MSTDESEVSIDILGYIKSFFPSSSSCEEEEKIKLSDYDITIYTKKREKIFWGTIAICLLYGIIAFLLLIACYTSYSIRSILLSRFLPFTIVFMVGTVLIVLYLSNQVRNFKPIKIDRASNYNSLSCPDYWRLEKVDVEKTSNVFDSNVNPMLFSYRCVMDNKIFNKGEIAKSDNTDFRIANNNNIPGDKIISSMVIILIQMNLIYIHQLML